jgi:hypothetical protein
MIEWQTMLLQSLQAEYGPRPNVGALATADEGGMPRARAVVCRRLADDGAAYITSDARSGKSQDTRKNPHAELVFWLPSRREQFRLWGDVERLGPGSNDPELADAWTQLPAVTRATFFWPQPGAPRGPDSDFPKSAPADLPPPQTFEVLVLRPTLVRYVALQFQPHRARKWTLRGSNWEPQDINP